MVRKIPFLRDAAEIVYSHQERFDGSGYPRGLKGIEIRRCSGTQFDPAIVEVFLNISGDQWIESRARTEQTDSATTPAFATL